MASRFMDVTEELQSLDTQMRDLAGALSPLVSGIEYSIQNSGRDSDGNEAPEDADILFIRSSGVPIVVNNRLKAATVLRIGDEPLCYTPVASEQAYVWCPYGESSISAVEAGA